MYFNHAKENDFYYHSNNIYRMYIVFGNILV